MSGPPRSFPFDPAMMLIVRNVKDGAARDASRSEEGGSLIVHLEHAVPSASASAALSCDCAQSAQFHGTIERNM